MKRADQFELTVVMPVYNEEEIIGHVVESWVDTLRTLDIKYEFILLNDGSKDGTLAVLHQLTEKYHELKIINKINSGHGPTLLQGYRLALAPWIFQVDSDNEMEAKHFHILWNIRNESDFIVGARTARASPLSREIITWVSRLTISILYGKTVKDVNSPYRLYRRDKFLKVFRAIPNDTFAPNVILSGIASLLKMRITEINIPCQLRTTGEVSIKRWKLFKVAVKSFLQTIIFRCTSSIKSYS